MISKHYFSNTVRFLACELVPFFHSSIAAVLNAMYLAEVGEVTFKSNGNEALNDESLFKK
jgi:hypothetical protein